MSAIPTINPGAVFAEAWRIYRDRIHAGLRFLGADARILECLRELFPGRTFDALPRPNGDAEAQASILEWVAQSAERRAEPIDTDRLWMWSTALRMLDGAPTGWTHHLLSKAAVSIYRMRLGDSQRDLSR